MAAAPQADMLLVQQTEMFASIYCRIFPLVFSLETEKAIQKVASSFALAHTQVWKWQRYLAKGHRTEMG